MSAREGRRLPTLPGPREQGLGLSLPEWQRTVARTLLGPAARPEDLEALGSPERWRIYRHMVRHRLRDMVRSGLPRTAEALGAERFETWLARWLAASPPRTRFIRDVVSEAEAHWLPRWEAGEAPAVEPWLQELCRYEAAVWRCRWAPDPPPKPPPFDFQQPVHFVPACELLRLRYPVHRRPTPPQGYAEEPAAVLLCRHPETLRVRYHVLPPLEAAIVEAWQRDGGQRPAAALAAEAASGLGVPVDPAFAERLGALASRLLAEGALAHRLQEQPSGSDRG